MAAVALAAGVLHGNNNNRRAQNHKREGCETTENDYFSMRVVAHESRSVATEYVAWRRRAGVKAQYHASLKRVKVFLHYLARGGYYHQLGRSEGLSESGTMVNLHSVATFFQETAHRYIFANS